MNIFILHRFLCLLIQTFYSITAFLKNNTLAARMIVCRQLWWKYVYLTKIYTVTVFGIPILILFFWEILILGWWESRLWRCHSIVEAVFRNFLGTESEEVPFFVSYSHDLHIELCRTQSTEFNLWEFLFILESIRQVLCQSST